MKCLVRFGRTTLREIICLGKRRINGSDRKETSAQFLLEYQAPATGEVSKSAQPSWIQMGSSISDFWRGGDRGGENMKINND